MEIGDRVKLTKNTPQGIYTFIGIFDGRMVKQQEEDSPNYEGYILDERKSIWDKIEILK